MRAALEALRAHGASAVVAAVPVGAPESCAGLGDVAEDVVCAVMPSPFGGVGRWYDDFSEITDDQVRAVLDRAQSAENGAAQGA